MAVSGELRYLGPDFSSVERVRPVKAMMRPESLAMGKMMRLRNLEYIASAAAGFWLLASGECTFAGSGLWAPDSGLWEAERGICFCGRPTADDSRLPSSFHENRPRSRKSSSSKSRRKASRRRKPESGAYPI